MIVYKIENLINGKLYIGITEQSLKYRWRGHLKQFRDGDTRHLYCAMRRYGIKNFIITQIDTADSYEELLEKEKYYVKFYDSMTNGYNMTPGGDSNPMNELEIKIKHDVKMRSDEVRQKISETMKQKSKEGKLFSDEHRKHLSDAAKGNHNFGSGDTRSIGCYCIMNDGTKIEFHSYLDAGRWWYENYKPFGEIYSEATYQRKIKKSIRGEPIEYSQSTKKDYKIITNIRWYKL